MKRLLMISLAAGIAMTGASAVQAISEAEISKDIEEFQGFFLKRFPGLTLDDFQDGVNALPQYAARRANWEINMDFPQYEPEMEKAATEWSAPFANGKSLADCDLAPGNTYPVFDAGSGDLRTIEGDINACLTANGEEVIKNVKRGKMARLVAHYKSQFNGERMAVDFSDPGARTGMPRGDRFIGQNAAS